MKKLILNSKTLVLVQKLVLMRKKKDNFISGSFKSKILNTNIKSNFNIDNKKLNLFDSYFRNKNISFNNKSLIIFEPFLEIELHNKY